MKGVNKIGTIVRTGTVTWIGGALIIIDTTAVKLRKFISLFLNDFKSVYGKIIMVNWKQCKLISIKTKLNSNLNRTQLIINSFTVQK